MLTAKQLLLKQTAEAFAGRKDMPICAPLAGITQEEASWQYDPEWPSIEQIVRHVAWGRADYCRQAFGTPMPLVDPSIDDNGDCATISWKFPCGAGWGLKDAPGIDGAIRLLEQSHQVLMQCLENCTDEALEQPIENRHGKTAAHFFWIMIMHDIYHAGQIRTRRTMYQSRKKTGVVA